MILKILLKIKKIRSKNKKMILKKYKSFIHLLNQIHMIYQRNGAILSPPKELIIDDPSQEIKTRASIRDKPNHFAFMSHIEPKTILEVEIDVN